MSSFLMDYPFADRLYPGALDVLKRLRSLGPTVILSDGDVVFQPRKVERAGLAEAVDGRCADLHPQGRGPGRRRAALSGRALRAGRRQAAHPGRVKQVWGERVTTVFPRQGQYAHDPKVLSALPPAD